MTTTLQVRMDKTIKEQAQKAFLGMGLDMSSGIKLFLTQVARTRSIPFPILSADNFSPAHKRKIIAEAEEAIKSGKSFDTAKELFDDILK